MKRRAQLQAETRERIVEAAVELHEKLGPKFTTVSSIAELAGVERLTVYRHFPDDTSLFQACTSHWLARNPLPDSDEWSVIADPRKRSLHALQALYAYYRSTEGMWTSAYRDLPDVPALQAPMDQVSDYLDSIAAGLLITWKPPSSIRSQFRSALSHSLRFSTWQSLKTEHLPDARMAHLMVLWFIAIHKDTKTISQRQKE